jgi:hypothetical protein
MYEIFMGEAGKINAAKGTQASRTTFSELRLIVTIGWAIYPIGYVIGYSASGGAGSLNLVYNLADFVNKIAFGIVIWGAATKAALRKHLQLLDWVAGDAIWRLESIIRALIPGFFSACRINHMREANAVLTVLLEDRICFFPGNSCGLSIVTFRRHRIACQHVEVPGSKRQGAC